MRDVYVQNSALGDPNSLDKQLEENAQKLDKLNQELQKFEVQKLLSPSGSFTPTIKSSFHCLHTYFELLVLCNKSDCTCLYGVSLRIYLGIIM